MGNRCRGMTRGVCFLVFLLLTSALFIPTAVSNSEFRTPNSEFEDPSDELTQAELMKANEEIASLSSDTALPINAKLDKVFKDYTTMGACVVVFQNGEVTYVYTYGDRIKGSGKIPGDPVTEDTLFQVGSISKMVAGIGLMCLVEDGMAQLDSDLGDLFGFPVRNPAYAYTPITLRQLMSHTAGIRDSGHYNAAILGRPAALSSLFTGNAARYTFLANSKPGMKPVYSNFGGGIGGSLIEALSGQTIDRYLSERVFAPLGITASYQASLLPAGVKLANMYTMPGRSIKKQLSADKTHITEPDPEHDYFLTAGKLIISAPDLAKLLIMLCDGGIYQGTRILNEGTAAEIRTPQNDRGSVTCASGRGLFMNIITDYQVEGRTMYGHGGKAHGMLCAVYFDPVDRTGIVMLTNGCNNRKVYHGVGMLGRAVMAICYAELIDGKHEVENPWLVVNE